LTLADRPLASADDLAKQLRAAGESVVALKLLRAGKAVTIQVRPDYRVTLSPAAEPKSEYFIGVSLETLEDALRAQLALPAGQGVLVNEVSPGSPAEKAGVKKHDVVLEVGHTAVGSPEDLARQVQAARDAPTPLKLLRAGKPVNLQVTGALRKVDASPSPEAARFMFVRTQNANVLYRDLAARMLVQADGAGELRPRLDQLEGELKALRTTLDQINETLKTIKRD
jgi:serine protease Do